MIAKFAVLLALVAWLPGCASVKPMTPVQWGVIAETASYTGSMLYLERKPQSLPAFKLAKAALDTALANGHTSAADLHQALSHLGVNALTGTTGLVIVDAAVVLVTTLQGGQAPLDQAPVAKAVMEGIARGLGDAISNQ
jgi:hypothetical protein